jgi:VWA domain-containing protein
MIKLAPRALLTGCLIVVGCGFVSPASAEEPKSRGNLPSFGSGHTSFYGLQGEGTKFVYVFDRSGSMGGSGESALRLAKNELLQSLESIGPTQQFQIVFYNERPTVFALAGLPGRLVFGNDQSKQQARRFIEEIKAAGGTDHEAALDLALRLHPDVIFFLTDADEPGLNAEQLLRIRRRNPGAVIHTIEFGPGPSTGDENFLVKLARENRGQYVYVDVSRAAK